MSMQQEIQNVIDRFHRKMEKDPEVRKEVEPLQKVFNLDLGTESYTLKLKDAQIYCFEPGMDENADVTVTTTPENLMGLIDGSLRPMRAYVLKKIQVILNPAAPPSGSCRNNIIKYQPPLGGSIAR